MNIPNLRLADRRSLERVVKAAQRLFEPYGPIPYEQPASQVYSERMEDRRRMHTLKGALRTLIVDCKERSSVKTK